MMRRFKTLLSFTFLLSIPMWCHAEQGQASQEEYNISAEKIIRFYYDNEDLIDVINELAALKEVNVVFPVGPNAISPEAKLTLHMEEKISLDQAWNILYTILDVAGYSLVERNPNTFGIIRTNREIIKGSLQVYMHVEPEDLPDTDKRIRYLYFMSNVKVSDAADEELQGLLTGMLPPETSSFKIDPASNAIIIAAKSSDIRSVMKIIKLLEKTTYKEKMELVKLQHTLASTVANLFNEEQKGILKTPADRHRYGVDTKKPSETFYFSKFVKVIADDRINALIVVGREEAVRRIKDFIGKYIDVPLESGQSILHVYQLQYLDAIDFAPILQQIVESAAAGGTGQVKAEGEASASIERYFEGVIVKADVPPSQTTGEENGNGAIYKGNNKLIVAARNADWKRIESLIEELDVPQPQVILQVLVADLTLDDIRLIGSWLRTPNKIALPKGFNFQADNLETKNIMVDNYDNPTTLGADLLQNYYDSSGNIPGTAQSYADIALHNSTLISFSDCENCWTWAILQLLSTLGYRKVLSLPHIIAVNNKDAEIVIGESRFVEDAAVGDSGGVTTATKKWIEANLTINLKPRVAYGEEADALTLDIDVNINDFKSTSFQDADKLIRKFKTISIVKTGDVIALGGLAKLTDTDSASRTPLISQVPILGYFFKQRKRQTPKTSLTVFIRPTIIQPKLRGGMGEYTQDYIKLTKKYTKEGTLFDSLKDPITRWFFKPESNIEESIDDFVARDELKNQMVKKEVKEPPSDQAQVTTVQDDVKNDTVINEPRKKRYRKLTARRGRSLFASKNEDDLESILADEENPFEQS